MKQVNMENLLGVMDLEEVLLEYLLLQRKLDKGKKKINNIIVILKIEDQVQILIRIL